jgi:hypothetical protein
MKIVFIAIVGIFLPFLTLAEPSDTVRVLMNTPLTIWENGLIKTTRDLNGMDFVESKHNIKGWLLVNIEYYPDDNAINMYMKLSGNGNKNYWSEAAGDFVRVDNKEIAREVCKAMIESVRSHYNRHNLNSSRSKFSSTLCENFESVKYVGYRPIDLCSDLDKMTTIKALTLYDEPPSKMARCQGSMSGRDVDYEWDGLKHLSN